VDEVEAHLTAIAGVQEVMTVAAGGAAHLTDTHLF
jgi:hypothetical protein